METRTNRTEWENVKQKPSITYEDEHRCIPTYSHSQKRPKYRRIQWECQRSLFNSWKVPPNTFTFFGKSRMSYVASRRINLYIFSIRVQDKMHMSLSTCIESGKKNFLPFVSTWIRPFLPMEYAGKRKKGMNKVWIRGADIRQCSITSFNQSPNCSTNNRKKYWHVEAPIKVSEHQIIVLKHQISLQLTFKTDLEALGQYIHSSHQSSHQLLYRLTITPDWTNTNKRPVVFVIVRLELCLRLFVFDSDCFIWLTLKRVSLLRWFMFPTKLLIIS